jgi:hypothetical protein
MTDILIPDITDDELSAIDKRAEEQGLTRIEYLKRKITQDNQWEDPDLPELTDEDMKTFTETFKDARNPEIMRKLWQ